MIEEFDKYVNNYDMNDELIKLKYNHSYRVMKLCEKYSKILKFNDYDIKLASLIGLLHDIGRFKQINMQHSLDDNVIAGNMDHADYGVYVLFDKGLIKKFWQNDEDYELIKFAIKNHNKVKIPNINNKRIEKFAKLIRDVDKVDILYLLGVLKEHKIESTTENISKNVIKSIKNHKLIKITDIKNTNDDLACEFAYAFDINYDVVLEEFKDNLKSYYKLINNENIFKEVYDEVIKYIDERIEKYVRY